MTIMCLDTENCLIYKTFVNFPESLRGDTSERLDVIEYVGEAYLCNAFNFLKYYKTQFRDRLSSDDKKNLKKRSNYLKNLKKKVSLSVECPTIKILNSLEEIKKKK